MQLSEIFVVVVAFIAFCNLADRLWQWIEQGDWLGEKESAEQAEPTGYVFSRPSL